MEPFVGLSSYGVVHYKALSLERVNLHVPELLYEVPKNRAVNAFFLGIQPTAQSTLPLQAIS